MSDYQTRSGALIFGAGVAGLNAVSHLQADHKILGFVDNDVNKQQSGVNGFQVWSPKQMSQLVYDAIYVASEFFEKIQLQLTELGVEKNKVKVLPAHMLASRLFEDSSTACDAAITMLISIRDAFDKQDIPYFLDAGTLLGLYRDGALIPWDDDLDIGVSYHDVERVKSALEEVLAELNQKVGDGWVVEEHKATQVFGCIEPGDTRSFKLKNTDGAIECPMLDVFIKYIEGDNMDYTLASRGIRMPSYHFENLQSLEFRGHVFTIPQRPEDYLEGYYGDWRTPVKNWDLSMIKAASLHD